MIGRAAAVFAPMLLVACSGAAEAGAPAKSAPACAVTRLVSVAPRLEGVPDSGVSVAYGNKLRQVSYDPIPGLQGSRPGDRVRLCVVSRPKNCPPGDVRGAKYSATNLRTGKRWVAADSSHRCGGA